MFSNVKYFAEEPKNIHSLRKCPLRLHDFNENGCLMHVHNKHTKKYFSFRTKVFFFHEKHTFQIILHLLICITKNSKKTFFSPKNGFCFTGGGVP